MALKKTLHMQIIQECYIAPWDDDQETLRKD